MRERSISEGLIVEALKFPTKISSDKQGRQLVKKLYIRRRSQRLLLIAVETKGEVSKIITVIETSKVRKYLYE